MFSYGYSSSLYILWIQQLGQRACSRVCSDPILFPRGMKFKSLLAACVLRIWL